MTVRILVLFAALGGEQRQHHAIGPNLVAGQRGNLAAARAGEQQQPDEIAERSAAFAGIPYGDDLGVAQRAGLPCLGFEFLGMGPREITVRCDRTAPRQVPLPVARNNDRHRC